MTAREMLTEIRRRLQEAGIEDFAYESWLLLEWKLHINRADFYMDPGRIIGETEQNELESVLKKREKRIPLQYLMEECSFMGYTFYVDNHVLIPRQDTECLVEYAAGQIEGHPEHPGEGRILDLCTGSGCIGLSVAKLCPQATVVLSDISPEALAVAGKNAERLGCHVTLIESDLFEKIEGTYDVILSNPPYIPFREIETLMPEVKDYEPRLALDGEEDGLAFYRRIIRQAPEYLNPGGRLVMEIGADQGNDLKHGMEAAGFSQVEIRKDLAGRDRIATGISNHRRKKDV